MAATKAVALCTHLLASGKLCRSVALRNERHCRAHIHNHRFLDRARVEEEALNRFADRVDTLDLADLLHLLHGKLEALNRAYNLGRFPEVRYLLTASMERLLEQTHSESNMELQDDGLQLLPRGAQLDPGQIRQMLAPSLESNR